MFRGGDTGCGGPNGGPGDGGGGGCDGPGGKGGGRGGEGDGPGLLSPPASRAELSSSSSRVVVVWTTVIRCSSCVIRSNLCRYFSGRTRGRGRLGDVAGGALELLAALLDVAHPHAHARRSTAPAAAPPRRGARTLATPARAITPLELDLIFDLFGPNFHTYGTLPPPP